MDTTNFMVTADTHFLHDNIVEFCGRPGYNPATLCIEDPVLHNIVMRNNWKRVVTPTTKVLHLGDLVLGKRADAERLYGGENELPGEKYLIKGNHDKRSDDFYKSLGFTVIPPFDLELDGWEFHYSHYPLTRLRKNQINFHGHIHNTFVDAVTRGHVNLGVDMRNYTPQNNFWHMKNAIRRMTGENRDRDHGPGGKDFDPPED